MTALDIWKELADTTDLGWPKWEARGNRYRLVFHDEDLRVQRWFKTFGGHWTEGHHVTDHEAECLFERHARRYLEKRRIWVQKSRSVETNLYVHRDVGDGPGEALCTDGKIRECANASEILGFGEHYRTALQAGVRAAHKEGKESP